METINNLKELLCYVLQESRQLNDAFTELDGLIEREAESIHIQERFSNIDTLKSRLVHEINRIQEKEYISERSSNAGKFQIGIARFVLGSIVGAMAKQENPLLSGYRSFSTELGKKEDFGSVMIAIKKSGKLEDIEAVSISSFVREYKTTESNIISIIRDNGYITLTPKEFWELLYQLKEDLVEGKYRSETEQVKALLHYVKKRNKCT